MKRSDFLKRLALLVFAPEVVVHLAEASSKIRVEPLILEPVYAGGMRSGKSDAFWACGTIRVEPLILDTGLKNIYADSMVRSITIETGQMARFLP